MIDLIPVCQSYPGCEMSTGWPIVGVVVNPPEATCVAYRLPSTIVEPCIELGDLVGLGRLYAFPGTAIGEINALLFTESGP